MKKYTIIYNIAFRSGSHTHTATELERVETDNLQLLMKEEKYNNAIFVFEGHPALEGEAIDPVKESHLALKCSVPFSAFAKTWVQLGNSANGDMFLAKADTVEDRKNIERIIQVWNALL
jgi:hypothetical protein